MKKLLFIILMLVCGIARADDTAALNALLAAGDYTSPAGHSYTISGVLNVYHAWHMNGSVVTCTQTTGGAVFMYAGSSIDRGVIWGNWAYTSAGNPSGAYGLRTFGSNVSVDNIHITNFASYGILANYSNFSLTNSTIEKTGYIGLYIDPENNSTSNITVTGNTFDRSMISATSILDACSDIRASTSNNADTLRNVNVANNIFKMPSLPSAANNECIELRYISNGTVSHNQCYSGSIGISCVRSASVIVNNNQTHTSKLEGIEFADSHNCAATSNNVNGSQNDAILLDGAVGCRDITLTNDTTSNSQTAVHEYLNTLRVTVAGGSYSYSKYGFNLQKSDILTLSLVTLNGLSNPNTSGIFLDTSPGNITASNVSVLNSTCVVNSYNNQLNYVVDHIHFTGIVQTGTPTRLCSNFSNGAHYGTDISFISHILTFNPISSRTYGAPDFDPGATSDLPIAYSSSNTSIATIVSNKVHIVKSGTCNIIANNGDSTATQPYTTNKAALSIYANNVSKYQGTVNPTLTAGYYGFVLGETNSVLTTQPVLSTTAITASPLGTYPISIGSATADNYNITFTNGVLTVIPRPSTYGSVFRIKVHVLH